MGGGANPFIQKYVKSITAVNHSILALSEVHQPAAARYCIQRVCGVSQNDYSIIGYISAVLVFLQTFLCIVIG